MDIIHQPLMVTLFTVLGGGGAAAEDSCHAHSSSWVNNKVKHMQMFVRRKSMYLYSQVESTSFYEEHTCYSSGNRGFALKITFS